MINQRKYLMFAGLMGFCALVYAIEAEGRHEIRIYLPRDKTLATEVVKLGQVAVVLGDEALVEIVNAMPLGQFSVHGQELMIDRKTILSRLASSGIKASSVAFNGAEIIRVRRDEKIVSADRFVDTARDYLRQQLSGDQIENLKLIRPVKDYPLDDVNKSVTLTPLMSERQSGRTRAVTVRVMCEGVELGRQEVVFSVQYPCHRLVAAHALPAGTLITPENTVVEKYMSNVPSQISDSLVYGMIAKRDIACGTTITEAMAGYKESPVLIKKYQKVILKLETGGLLVSAPGEATQDGRLGDIIPVQRGSRQTRDLKIVLGEVMPDGTVKPVL